MLDLTKCYADYVEVPAMPLWKWLLQKVHAELRT